MESSCYRWIITTWREPAVNPVSGEIKSTGAANVVYSQEIVVERLDHALHVELLSVRNSFMSAMVNTGKDSGVLFRRIVASSESSESRLRLSVIRTSCSA